MDTFDLQAAQKEVYQWAVSKGWEPDNARTFMDECALVHSEISEALEAYRSYGFVDVTDTATGKPEGVASELADVLIRLLHYSAAGRFSLGSKVVRYMPGKSYQSFGDEVFNLHSIVSKSGEVYIYNRRLTRYYMMRLVSALLDCCDRHGFDLESEFRRKMDYNYTRAHRHGGKAM